jgi:hypothetical protein
MFGDMRFKSDIMAIRSDFFVLLFKADAFIPLSVNCVTWLYLTDGIVVRKENSLSITP